MDDFLYWAELGARAARIVELEADAAISEAAGREAVRRMDAAEARLAELIAELAAQEDRTTAILDKYHALQARIAELEAELEEAHAHADRYEAVNRSQYARLAAVIALCDEASPTGWQSTQVYVADVRAAAEGETK